MRHQSGNKKLNLKSPHRCALLRNYVIHFIDNGHLITTKAAVKQVKRLAEKVVTIARQGKDFNSYRKVKALLPYKKESIDKLFKDIAPKYVDRPGGYTRAIHLANRKRDTAPISRLEWV